MTSENILIPFFYSLPSHQHHSFHLQQQHPPVPTRNVRHLLTPFGLFHEQSLLFLRPLLWIEDRVLRIPLEHFDVFDAVAVAVVLFCCSLLRYGVT